MGKTRRGGRDDGGGVDGHDVTSLCDSGVEWGSCADMWGVIDYERILLVLLGENEAAGAVGQCTHKGEHAHRPAHGADAGGLAPTDHQCAATPALSGQGGRGAQCISNHYPGAGGKVNRVHAEEKPQGAANVINKIKEEGLYAYAGVGGLE